MQAGTEEHWVRFTAEGARTSIAAFLRAYPTEAELVRRDDETVAVRITAPQWRIDDARDHGLQVTDVIDLYDLLRARGPEVGRGNRFADGSVPRGLGVVRARVKP
jgi:hypothetical protein